MAHRNAVYFRGPNFEEQLIAAQEEHAKLVGVRKPKVHWKEPSQHDIMYSKDDETGQTLFFPSSVPAEPGLGIPEPDDISDRIRRQMQGKAMLELARELGAETFEEANDFQVTEGQDLCPFSGHEYDEQDEQAVHSEHQKLVKSKEEKDAQEAKRQRYEDLKALQKEFDPPAAPSQEGSDTAA